MAARLQNPSTGTQVVSLIEVRGTPPSERVVCSMTMTHASTTSSRRSRAINRQRKTMNPSAKLSELIEALEFESEESVTRFDRQTGHIVSVDRHILSAFEEGEEDELGDLADWQKEGLEIAKAVAEDAGERFIDAPDKFDFHEYRHMERFIGTVENTQAAEELWRAIKGKGAFRYFKDTGHRLGLLDQWYHYRDEAVKEHVIAWAEANQVTVEDDTQQRKS
jgi:hypothetical protein